jgi:hypothetical protein
MSKKPVPIVAEQAPQSVGFRVFPFEACSAFTARFGLHHRQVAKRPSTPKTPTDSSPPLPLRLLTG